MQPCHSCWLAGWEGGLALRLHQKTMVDWPAKDEEEAAAPPIVDFANFEEVEEVEEAMVPYVAVADVMLVYLKAQVSRFEDCWNLES